MKENLIQKTERHERGQSLVELAISLIAILYLLMGAVEFSMALFQYVTIRDAAQEGANYGSIHPADPANPSDLAAVQAIKERVKATASDFVPLADGDITILPNGPTCEGTTLIGGVPVPNSITVTVRYSHQIFLPLVTPMIGTDHIDLTAVATNTVLNPICP